MLGPSRRPRIGRRKAKTDELDDRRVVDGRQERGIMPVASDSPGEVVEVLAAVEIEVVDVNVERGVGEIIGGGGSRSQVMTPGSVTELVVDEAGGILKDILNGEVAS